MHISVSTRLVVVVVVVVVATTRGRNFTMWITQFFAIVIIIKDVRLGNSVIQFSSPSICIIQMVRHNTHIFHVSLATPASTLSPSVASRNDVDDDGINCFSDVDVNVDVDVNDFVITPASNCHSGTS